MSIAPHGPGGPEASILAARLRHVYARERVQELLRAVAADALGTRASAGLGPAARETLTAALEGGTGRVAEAAVALLADELAGVVGGLDPALRRQILARQVHEELGHE